MRLTDLLVFPLVALWQQKGRTVLTTMGVVFGAFVLAASLSINHGVQETISRESKRTDALRRVNVHPKWENRTTAVDSKEIVVEGQMSEEKRQRIRTALAAAGQNQSRSPDSMVLLNPETLQKLSSIEHVQRIEPLVHFWESVQVNGHTNQVQTESASPEDPAYLRRIVAGRYIESPDEPVAIVSEFLLYRCGIADDEAIEKVLGQKLRIEIHPQRKSNQQELRVYLYRPNGGEQTPIEKGLIAGINKRLPDLIQQLDLNAAETEILKLLTASRTEEPESEPSIVMEFTIVGVMRQVTDQELNDRRWWDYLGGNPDVLLPYQTATDFYFSTRSTSSSGLQQVSMIADREEHVKKIAEQVKEMGLQANAPIEFIERERLTWRLVFGGMTCIAAVALLVAAMGITNTMLMSVLERTREIGIMKSVGAAGIHIQAIFLIEGILIGTIGGVIGLMLAIAASIPGDTWVRSMVERDMNVKLKDALFVFPPWLIATVVLFATIVTTIAALYPARRAACIDPVIALRHE